MVNCKLPFWDFGVRKVAKNLAYWGNLVEFGSSKRFDDSTTVFQLGFLW